MRAEEEPRLSDDDILRRRDATIARAESGINALVLNIVDENIPDMELQTRLDDLLELLRSAFQDTLHVRHLFLNNTAQDKPEK